MFRSIIAALGAACLAAVAGCGGSEADAIATSENSTLAQVGSLYVAQWQTKNKAPVGLKDFQPNAESLPDGVSAIGKGDVVVIWGVKLDDLSLEGAGDSADEVLAYEKAAPESGGFVLMKNRTIRKMTADEFKAAPKAAGTTEDATAKPGKSAKAG